MSKFLTNKKLVPYTPGEQPRGRQYIKLNTNESPFPPSEKAKAAAKEALDTLHLYPDPTCAALSASMAEALGVSTDEVILGNGSDEILFFAFSAFCDANCGAVFPSITYSFYSVFAELCKVPYTKIPLREDFTICPQNYIGLAKTIFIANPNAPTGIALQRAEIETILKNNPAHVVVIDEAYVDFGGESCVPLIHQYENLLVVQTFSKSRSMAGARLGMGIGSKALIQDLNTIKYSVNPYNINRMTMAAGMGALADADYTKKNCAEIIQNRLYTTEALTALGFVVTPSCTNFVFAKHPQISGQTIYSRLKEKNILVRHFDTPEITAYNRITIGTKAQMDAFLSAIQEILEEEI
ncbi:MAG: histidinol-phosphate transaminase [Clostridia bacterium]|nr:histidinol-phosphate transaminase [Clostridia bacterium]